MAFQVGAIVSKLMLDKSGWNQAVKEVGTDQTKMQGMSEQTSRKFRKMGAAMTVAGGAIVGALGAMTKKFVETGDWIDKMAARTGFSAEALSELAYAADLSGATLTDVERAVKRMAGSILDAHSGLESYARAFRVLGLSVDDLMKMNPEQQFLAISEAIAAIEDPTIRAALAQDVFGRAGTSLLPMMKDGAEGLRDMREEARELGIIFTDETAKSAADLKDAQTALKESVKGLSMAFTQHIVPVLTKVVQAMTGTIAKVSEWARENPQLAQTIVKVAAALGGALTVLGPMVMIVPKLVAGAKMLAGGFTALLSPVGLLTAALAALAIGYLKVKDAQKKAEESARTYAAQNEKLFKKLEESAEAAGMTKAEFAELRKEYDDNSAALAMAIKRGEEGVELQKALAEHTSDYEKEAEAAREQTEDYTASMGDLTGKFQGYLDELKETKKEQKTWIDYLKTLGVKTVKEKGDRVKELEGYLKDLKIAYDNGKLSLEDYVESTNAAKAEIEELTTVIVTSAIPEQRNWGDVVGQTTGDMAIHQQDYTEHVKTETKKQAGVWDDLHRHMMGSLSDNLQRMIGGQQSFGDTMANLWGDLKGKVIQIFVDIGLAYAAQFVAKMITGAGEAVTGILGKFKGLGGGLSGIFKGIFGGGGAGGVAGAAGGLWTGVGAAVGSFLGSILGPKGVSKRTGQDQLHELRLIKQVGINTQQHEFVWVLEKLSAITEYTGDRIPEKVGAVVKRLDTVKGYQNRIAKATEKTQEHTALLKKMIGAAEGAIVSEPTLAVLHGSPSNPEVVLPMSKMMDFSMMQKQKEVTAQLKQDVTVNIQVKDHLDPYSAQEIVRKQIIPETLRAIELDARNKTKLRDVLGIQV